MARNTYVPPASQALYAAELALESVIRDARAYHRIEQRHRKSGSWVTRFQLRTTAHDAIRGLRGVRVAKIADRLEYLRGEIEAERISYSEIAELQGYAGSIPSNELELRQWAGLAEQVQS